MKILILLFGLILISACGTESEPDAEFYREQDEAPQELLVEEETTPEESSPTEPVEVDPEDAHEPSLPSFHQNDLPELEYGDSFHTNPDFDSNWEDSGPLGFGQN